MQEEEDAGEGGCRRRMLEEEDEGGGCWRRRMPEAEDVGAAGRRALPHLPLSHPARPRPSHFSSSKARLAADLDTAGSSHPPSHPAPSAPGSLLVPLGAAGRVVLSGENQPGSVPSPRPCPRCPQPSLLSGCWRPGMLCGYPGDAPGVPAGSVASTAPAASSSRRQSLRGAADYQICHNTLISAFFGHSRSNPSPRRGSPFPGWVAMGIWIP